MCEVGVSAGKPHSIGKERKYWEAVTMCSVDAVHAWECVLGVRKKMMIKAEEY